MPLPSRHRLLVQKLLVAFTVLVATLSLVPTPDALGQGASRDVTSEAGFLTSINAERSAGGLEPLTLNFAMAVAAREWTQEMVEGSFLAHATDIVTGTPDGWDKVGENVGRGQSVTTLTSAFMDSAGHRANIMDPTFTQIGIAVYTHPTDGRIYTTHRFAAVPTQDVDPATPPESPVTQTPSTASPTDSARAQLAADTDAVRFDPAPAQLAFVADNESELRAAKLASKFAKSRILDALDR